MDRREFLKRVGRAGLTLSAGALLSGRLLRKAGAADGAQPMLIKLHGSPKEIGRQYADQAGDLIRERLKLMRERTSRISRETIQQSRIFLVVKANSVMGEIEHLAAALNEPEDELLILSAEMPGAGLRQGGCSSFVIDPKVSKDKHVWAGQNVDDASELERFGVILLRHPQDSSPMITWALAGGVGAIGMNMEGLTLTMDYMQAEADRLPEAIFPEFLANSALRQKNFKDASAVLTQEPLMNACAFLLSDAEGARLIIERTTHIFRAFMPGTRFAAHTNHFTQAEFKTQDAGDKVFPDSKSRLRRLNALLDRMDLSADDLKKILADTEGKPHGICRFAEPATIASILMCPKEKRMLATRGRPDKSAYHEFTLTARPERE